MRRRQALAFGLSLLSAVTVSCKDKGKAKPSGEGAAGAVVTAAPVATPVDPKASALAALPTDVLITAHEILGYHAAGDDDTARRRTAAFIAQVSAQRVVIVNLRGDAYVHELFDAPADGLGHANLFAEYLNFLGTPQERVAGPVTADRDIVDTLALNLDREALAGELERRAQLAVELVTGLVPDPATAADKIAFYLDRGRALDEVCHGALAQVAGRAGRTVERVSLASEQRLRLLLGAQAQCMAVAGGKLVTEMSTPAQWQEFFALAVEPLSPPQPFYDAHLHVLGQGGGRAQTILELVGATGATAMTLLKSAAATSLPADNQTLFDEVSAHTGLLSGLVVLNPHGDERVALEELERGIARGARGVKLLSGHGDLWSQLGAPPLDTPLLDKLLDRCAQARLPVLWHVNVHLLHRGALEAIARHRDVNFVLAHFAGYLTFAPELVEQLLTEHPNLYLDLSLGSQPWYVRRGLEDLSLAAARWKRLIDAHPTRFLFAVDLVVTETTSLSHARSQTELHLSMLAATRYRADLVPLGGTGRLGDLGHHPGDLTGLALSGRTAKLVFAGNAKSLGLAP